MDITASCPEENAFFFHNGIRIRTIKDLLSVLSLIDEDTFRTHANEHKNDFSSWIEDVFKEKTLADELKGKHRNDAITVLERFLAADDPAKDEKQSQGKIFPSLLLEEADVTDLSALWRNFQEKFTLYSAEHSFSALCGKIAFKSLKKCFPGISPCSLRFPQGQALSESSSVSAIAREMQKAAQEAQGLEMQCGEYNVALRFIINSYAFVDFSQDTLSIGRKKKLSDRIFLPISFCYKSMDESAARQFLCEFRDYLENPNKILLE